MEQIQIMGMELEQSWIIAGGVALVLLIAVVWILVRRRSKSDGDPEPEKSPQETVRLTEPTLEPLPEVSEVAEPEAAEPESVEASAEEPGPEPDTEVHPAPESDPEPEVESEQAPEEHDEKPDTADAPEPSTVSDPAFLAAREAFERELLAGNFSRLDVFEAYAQAKEKPNAPDVPRSEYFHGVVNQALEIRDAFEALLLDADREQFVDMHSRYLDDVTTETDADVRERLHREHQEKLGTLRPKDD